MKLSTQLIGATVLALSSLSLSAFAETRMFTVTAVEIDGTKFWLPSTIVVKKGDVVKLHLLSKVKGDKAAGADAKGIVPHGFAIPDFKIEQVVDSKGKDVEFTADKAGVFQTKCQMHPAHIGGQLVVLE